MKNILILILLLNSFVGSAQTLKMIEISDVKTTVIYFPEDVTDINVGFPDDFDKTYNGKVVKITALGLFGYTTNLTVITTAGVYGFDIKYKEDPTNKYYTIEPDNKAIIFKEPLLEAKTKNEETKDHSTTINNILTFSEDSYIQYKSEQSVYFVFNGAYVKEEKIYFHISIDNRSAIDYDIDYVSVKNVSTKKNTKRAAKEQYDIKYIDHALNEKIKVKEKKSFVLEISKLTLKPKTKIQIEIHELNGGRDGIFSYTKKDFKKIKPIN